MAKASSQKINKKSYKVAVIALVLVLLLIGGLSWWYVSGTNSLQDSMTSTNSTDQKNIKHPSEPTTNPGEIDNTQNNVFKIQELGIQITLPDSLEGLEYIVQTNEATGDVSAYFTTSSLMSADGNDTLCTAKRGAVGAILRSTKDHSGEAGYPIMKRLGDSFYGFAGPPQPCTSSEKAGQLELQQTNLLQQAFSSLALIN